MNYIKLFQNPDGQIQKSKQHFTKQQNDDLIYYYNELKKQNLSDNQIVAILANAMQESSLNHSSINNKSGAKGLLQLKDQDLQSYNKFISENNMEDTGLSQILFYLYRINNDIDYRRDTYKNALELSQSKNKVDRDNGLKGLKLFEGMENKWFTEDFVRLFWNNDKASLNDLIKGWMDYIERPSQEEKNESINKRYNYGKYIYNLLNNYKENNALQKQNDAYKLTHLYELKPQDNYNYLNLFK